MIFGIVEPVTTPQNHLFLFSGTPGYLTKNPENHRDILKHIILQIAKAGESHVLHFWERRAPNNDEDPLNSISKLWI